MSTQKSDGMNYAPVGTPRRVGKPGEFVFAATHMDHGHIWGQTGGLVEAGGTVKWVYDPDADKTKWFAEKYATAKIARSLEEVLEDDEVTMVASAAVPNERGPWGCKVME